VPSVLGDMPDQRPPCDEPGCKDRADVLYEKTHLCGRHTIQRMNEKRKAQEK